MSNIKQSPFLGLTGMGGGGTGLAVGGAVAKKVYIDNIFSTFLYRGNGSNSRDIVNNIDLSSDGGFVWTKNRDNGSYGHNVFDTERGAAKMLSLQTVSQQANEGNTLTTFNSNGFRINDDNNINRNNEDYTSFTFKKTERFFDVVKWDGDGASSRQISHNLKCIPGFIIMKAYEHPSGVGNTDWQIYHRGLNGGITPEQYAIMFTNGAEGDNSWFGDTAPTSTHFTIGGGNDRNGTGGKYVAYVFAGGASTAATARSVLFKGNADNGSSQYCFMNSATAQYMSGEFNFGTNDFTFECWVNPNSFSSNSGNKGIFGIGHLSENLIMEVTSNGRINIVKDDSTILNTSDSDLPTGQWTHIALVRHSNTLNLYLNGRLYKSGSLTASLQLGTQYESLKIGNRKGDEHSGWRGHISNFRIVKGTAVYTSGFIPSYKPLENISGTIVLCCQNSSVDGSTVFPSGGNLSNYGNETASALSPFDDADAFKFGDGRDEPIIKCGYFTGTGATYNPVHIGFEPQWLLVKNASSTSGGGEDWFLVDCMRGWPIPTSASENQMHYFVPNNSNAENTQDWADPMSDGFMCRNGNDAVNGSGHTMIYVAIRRSDGAVTAKPEAGTDSFTSSLYDSTAPAFNTNFPVDLALFKRDSVYDWRVMGRLIEKKWLKANSTVAQSTENDYVFDYNDGWNLQTGYANAEQSWMWKRGKGFDVVRKLKLENRHNLDQVPEMVWTKRMDNGSAEWYSWHKDLGGGGSNAVGYHIKLNESQAESNSNVQLCPIGDALPTATHFKTGTDSDVRNDGGIAFLFASVTGISKCGTYTGSSSSFTVNLGFQPRLLIVKGRSSSKNWIMFDTTTGWAKTSMGGAETTKYWAINDNGGTTVPAVVSGSNIVCYPVATGVYFTGLQNSLYGHVNANGEEYVYYAHA
tara:strand:- start:54 stop:2804 length:2751 start_codon:yes stop_codon:yes gene_type:complete